MWGAAEEIVISPAVSRFANGQYRLSTARWPSHYAYMQDGWKGFVSVWSGDAGPQGWWQLINHPTMKGYYLMSTSKWPECFAFMEQGLIGHCRGWNKCDPGPQGYMKFVPHMDERGQPDGYYMITPQKPGWEDKWFIYVENGFSGTLSSWSGDPGPQGWFKVEPWNININQAMDQISKTMKKLPDMPMLGSVASGYNGPDSSPAPGRPLGSTGQPQALSEIRLEATYAEGCDLKSLAPSQRIVTFFVDQHSSFTQIVGRQHQEAFFCGLVPQRDLLASLSRSVFELTLDPPSSQPMLKKLTQSMVDVGGQHLRSNESTRVGDGTQIRLGGGDGQTPIVVLTIHCVRRGGGGGGYSGGAGVEATCAALPRARQDPGSYSGSKHMQPAPSPVPSGYDPVDSYDNRPGTLPQWPQSGGGASRGGPKAVLECYFSAGMASFNRASAVIELIPDQEVPIGRLHQMGFFEKLLPNQDQLACISRKHLTARLHKGGHLVEIENLSRNTITLDGRAISQGERGELREGSTLMFVFCERPLLEFRLKSEGGSSMPATRFG